MANKPKEDANGASLATMPSADAARIIPHVSLSNLSDTQANERVKQQIARHREKEPGPAASQPDTIKAISDSMEKQRIKSFLYAVLEKEERYYARDDYQTGDYARAQIEKARAFLEAV